jgi:ubiquinone/menaquinone biosynthesis C-methylase UbiE
MPKLKSSDTSWGRDAEWYDELLAKPGTYQEEVVLPNLARLLEAESGTRVLDVACGQGYFARAIAAGGATVHGVDASPSLIKIAKELGGGPTYAVSPAEDLRDVPDASYDRAVIVLAIQNIEPAAQTIAEAARVLAAGGRLVIVMNHPAFRVPKHSDWAWSEDGATQYRREDRYMSELREKIQTHPGSDSDRYTYSFHRPLQYYVKAIAKAGMAVSRLEEWTSNRKSQPGPRAQAEDRARAEFPLFLTIEARKHG